VEISLAGSVLETRLTDVRGQTVFTLAAGFYGLRVAFGPDEERTSISVPADADVSFERVLPPLPTPTPPRLPPPAPIPEGGFAPTTAGATPTGAATAFSAGESVIVFGSLRGVVVALPDAPGGFYEVRLDSGVRVTVAAGQLAPAIGEIPRLGGTLPT
jgi:hypothetical protein